MAQKRGHMWRGATSVSYTHLDVYKRQVLNRVKKENCILYNKQQIYKKKGSRQLSKTTDKLKSVYLHMEQKVGLSLTNTQVE